ncbi:MAG: response regulator [Xanthomonadales bacterium]|nr:response regulator [Xanthomonadales bacterium]
MAYKVALCGLTVRDQRLIEIVLSRAPNPKHAFQICQANLAASADIAIVDASTKQADTIIAELQTLNPDVVLVCVSDLGMSGNSRYRIDRRSVLLKVNRVLDEVVENEFLKQPQAGPGRPPAQIADREATEQPATAQPLRALVVDDSQTIREQLLVALESLGVQSDQADCAESALRLLQSNNYDLVFLDVVMPGADGYEVCRWIKTDAYKRSVPVLMLTSSASPFDRARGALAGCDSYLAKPVTWGTFFGAIDQVLLKHFKGDRERLSARGYREASFAA